MRERERAASQRKKNRANARAIYDQESTPLPLCCLKMNFTTFAIAVVVESDCEMPRKSSRRGRGRLLDDLNARCRRQNAATPPSCGDTSTNKTCCRPRPQGSLSLLYHHQTSLSPTICKLTGEMFAPGHAARQKIDPSLQGAGRDERGERPRAARAAAAASSSATAAVAATGAGRHDSPVELFKETDGRIPREGLEKGRAKKRGKGGDENEKS